MTVLEVIRKSAEFLDRKGVEQPRLQVEWMLARLLQLPRLQLYLNFERVVEQPQLDILREQIRRRAQHEPLQHILGTTQFCGLELRVDRRALIPRPETELLAEQAWSRLNALAARRIAAPTGSPSAESASPIPPAPSPGSVHALDFGTGSGCLAITIACRCTAAYLTAIDVSQDALDLAAENAAACGVASRIRFVRVEPSGPLPPPQAPGPPRYDLVVANPPYIPSAEIDTLMPEVRLFDPRLALDGGPDGLAFYRRLAAEARSSLAPEGELWLELGDGQAGAVTELLQAQQWVVEPARPDYTGALRILAARPR